MSEMTSNTMFSGSNAGAGHEEMPVKAQYILN